jgi:hypothetical protein
LWAPDKLAKQLAAARNTGRVWAYGGAVHVNIELRVLSAQVTPSPERLVRALPGWSMMPGGASNAIVRADVFSDAGAWDPRLINLADWDLWARLARRGLPASVDRPLVGYRIHSGNASANIGLILDEARLINGRYGAKVDYGELHHYLAWVHLRSGRRRQAVSHLLRAASHGRVLDVGRTVTKVAAAQIGRYGGWLQPRLNSTHLAWIGEAETWVSRLRGSKVEE